MPVVFDQIEGTVESDETRGASGSSSQGAGGNRGKEMTLEQVALNLRRLGRAQMRLLAD